MAIKKNTHKVIDSQQLLPVHSEATLNSSFPYKDRSITTRLGYKIEVKDDSGAWLKKIIWTDDNGSARLIKTAMFFTGQADIDQITSALLHHLLTRYLGKTIQYYANGIELFTSEVIQGKGVKEAINSAITHINNDSDLTAIKRLVEWFIAYELPDISYDFAEEVLKLSTGGDQNAYSSLFTLDAELGPFTREENGILKKALDDPYIHLEDRVILALCMTFGLRPIQISLLKQSDFIERADMGISYLNVPRVKQGQPTRRTQFTKRVLKPETATLIKDLISTHQNVYADLNLSDPPLIMRRTELFSRKEKHPYKKTFNNHFFNNNNNYVENFDHSNPQGCSMLII